MIKGILFDKDGTIIEFNQLWVKVTLEVIDTLLRENQLQHTTIHDEVIRVLGIQENGTIHEHSVLAGETIYDSAVLIAPLLKMEEQQVATRMNELYLEKTKANKEKIKPIGNVRQVFQRLKEMQYKIGIVTADNYDLTVYTLELLGLSPYIDFIATADTYEKKPSAAALTAFCDQFSFSPQEVIHIGDTVIDMQFAKHAKLGVGVLSGIGEEDSLKEHTMWIIPSIEDLLTEDGQLVIE